MNTSRSKAKKARSELSRQRRPMQPARRKSLLVPAFDGQRLTLGGRVVKEFKRQPAENQKLVLWAFEKEKWPHRVVVTLPRVEGLRAKSRLNETVRSLNRGLDLP